MGLKAVARTRQEHLPVLVLGGVKVRAQGTAATSGNAVAWEARRVYCSALLSSPGGGRPIWMR
jgi:hypothetical protein